MAAGGLNYPGIGSTEHGPPPEGYPCLVSQTYLGDGLAVYRRVAQGILTWELQRRSGLLIRTESDVVIPGARVVSGFGVGSTRRVAWWPAPRKGTSLRDTLRGHANSLQAKQSTSPIGGKIP